jgi:hypothetical protein
MKNLVAIIIFILSSNLLADSLAKINMKRQLKRDMMIGLAWKRIPI